MKQFTFGILTYNQERFIIEHLESIKYQIEHYGKDIEYYLAVGDDASKDNTIKYIESWIKLNKSLFADVKYIVAQKNNGIVANYTSLLKSIKTDNFKIMAGDDLYYKNNIFEIVEDADFVITPILDFSNYKFLYNKRAYYMFNIFIGCKDKLLSYIRDRMTYNYPFQTPGLFFCKHIVDEGLYEVLNDFKWIEDVPEMSYLLNKNDIHCVINKKPYVLYRNDVGISNNHTHSKKSKFDIEHSEIEARYHYNRSQNIAGKLMNFYHFKYSVEKIKLKYWDSWFNKDLVNFTNSIIVEEQSINQYLDYIKCKADNFYKEVEQ